jgi:hypothetical protein
VSREYYRDTRTNEITTVGRIPADEIQHFVIHQGPVTTDHPCDERCTDAKGPICNCACGGINHGKAWDAERTQEELF